MIDLTQAPPSEWTETMQNVYSQFGEDGLLQEIFRRIGTTNKQCFECGAADGKWFSNTRFLIDQGWQAALIEANERNWPELMKLDNPPRVQVVQGKAEARGENSIDSVLSLCGFSERPDLGVLDVDGQEYYLWNGMMKCRPRVMVVEYDHNADPEFVPDLNGQGQASFAAICSVAISKGYFNASVTETNAIFIHNSERKRFLEAATPNDIAVANAPAAGRPHRITVEAPIQEQKPVNGNGHPVAVPTIATGKEQEIKIAAILSRPRFGLNVFWDCASEALAPWHIPIQSMTTAFWNQGMEIGFENNIDECDWILTLDYDTLFSSKHVQQLIDGLAQNPQIDALAALQCRRGRPLPLAVRHDGTMQITGGPVQVRTAHFGLTLFRCAAFKKLIRKPWFIDVPDKSGGWGEGKLDADISFWALWGDSGNTVYVHTSCCAGHVEEMASEYYPDNGQMNVRHVYLSDWRKANGHTVKTLE